MGGCAVWVMWWLSEWVGVEYGSCGGDCLSGWVCSIGNVVVVFSVGGCAVSVTWWRLSECVGVRYGSCGGDCLSGWVCGMSHVVVVGGCLSGWVWGMGLGHVRL